MKNVLIVEDEKMIRQGIRTMIQRCGVTVEEILECANGEAALDILKDKSVDLMFTDIRMPKMDGIQLVEEVRKLENCPLMVAISGYDDFSYAVEMLRNGVREYILKPVEREKIAEIMERMEAELQEKEEGNYKREYLEKSRIRHLLTAEPKTEEELPGDEELFRKGYVIFVAGKDNKADDSDLLFETELENCRVYIVEAGVPAIEFERNIPAKGVGVSSIHMGLGEIRTAYLEAFESRKRAFYFGKSMVHFNDPLEKIPEKMKENAKKYIDKQSFSKRLYNLGTGDSEADLEEWNKMFTELKRGFVEFEDFEYSIEGFLADLTSLYHNLIDSENSVRIANLDNIYSFSNIEEYEKAFIELIIDMQKIVFNALGDNGTYQRIKQAVDYIEKNYGSDINMAVVSNEISMNYSLFSFAFKQFTGKNFVNYLRDLRINKAKELLGETDYKILDISRMTGYDNEKHFMKVFKGTCGITPGEYRKNIKILKGSKIY